MRNRGESAAEAGRENLYIINGLQKTSPLKLLPPPPTEAKFQEALRQTSPQDLAQERQRFAAHRQHFRLQSRSLRQTQAQFDQLRQQWSVLPPTGTG